MKPARKKRLFFIVFLIAGVALAAGFAMYAFNQNLMFYFSPSDVKEGKAPANKLFRMGESSGSYSRPAPASGFCAYGRGRRAGSGTDYKSG